MSDVVQTISSITRELDVEIVLYHAVNVPDDSSLELDEHWKSKATTYISHIRMVVSKAEVQEALRERIFKNPGALQAEIDRNRTRVESISEVFLSITEAVGKGAKHLDGAVRLVERLAGAFSCARTAKLEGQQRRLLPPPDELGLPDLEEPQSDNDDRGDSNQPSNQ
ncbi:MAG: hypothetical protein ABSE20_03660 [Acetobacteraceae bacterium]